MKGCASAEGFLELGRFSEEFEERLEEEEVLTFSHDSAYWPTISAVFRAVLRVGVGAA